MHDYLECWYLQRPGGGSSESQLLQMGLLHTPSASIALRAQLRHKGL
jgi:hypothetical protein